MLSTYYACESRSTVNYQGSTRNAGAVLPVYLRTYTCMREELAILRICKQPYLCKLHATSGGQVNANRDYFNQLSSTNSVSIVFIYVPM